MELVEFEVHEDYVSCKSVDWIAATTTPCERLDELYAVWTEREGANFPYGAVEFLQWLIKLGVKIEGPHWSQELNTYNTLNEETPFSDEDFHHTIFVIGEAYHVAISDQSTVGNPNFYELTTDAPDDFDDWRKAYVLCEGSAQHVFQTEDLTLWQFFNQETSEEEGEHFRIEDIFNEESKTHECPVCGSAIKKGGHLG